MFNTTHELDSAVVGDGATINCYSDRKACTIVKRDEKRIWVQRDKATLINGYSSGQPDALKFTAGGFHGHTEGVQRYSYEPDPNGEICCYSRREWYNDYLKKWMVYYIKVGHPKKNGESISAGRHEHYDFNF